MKKFPFRAALIEERRKFYEEEFNIEKLKKWFRKNKIELPQLCAIDAGDDSGIILNKKLKGKLLYFNFFELKNKIKKYVPEDIYYDRNKYENPSKALKKLYFEEWKKQELVFDVDCDNIKCNHKNKEAICEVCLKKAFLSTKKIKYVLENEYNLKKFAIIYSGRGFHIHVLDKEAFYFDIKKRKKIAERLKKFPIDEWVSEGNISLIRMPYSLNSLVSRIVLPVSLKENFYLKKSVPKFLK